MSIDADKVARSPVGLDGTERDRFDAAPQAGILHAVAQQVFDLALLAAYLIDRHRQCEPRIVKIQSVHDLIVIVTRRRVLV